MSRWLWATARWLLLLKTAAALELRPLSARGRFGLEVVGLDNVTESAPALRSAFAASRGLLLLRNLQLKREDIVELSEVFGCVEASPADGDYERLLDGDARVHEFSTVPSSGVFKGDAAMTANVEDCQYDAATGRPSWHTDQSFRSPRPLASAMYCVATPSARGVGRTLFASTVAALEDLPARARERLGRLRAAHSHAALAANFARFAGGGNSETLSKARAAALAEPAMHALVDGGALYLAPHAIDAVFDDGGPLDDSRGLVDALSARCTRARYVHAHDWVAGDYVVWNNWATMHAATGVPPSLADQRKMWRTTMTKRAGAAEVADAAVATTASAARGLVEAALIAAGSCEKQAQAAAECFVGAEIDGKPDHGLRRVAEVCDALRRGDVAGDPEIRVEKGGAVIKVDGGGGLAHPALRAAVDAISRRAKITGVAIAAITHTASTSGRLAPWVEELARRGLVAALTCNTPAYLAVPGGSADRVLGTNPLAWAAPRRDGEPVVVDMALSATSRAAVEVAAAAGEPLRPGAAVDADGAPTTDATRALDGAQLPFGGVKGALMALLVEVLAGALTGSELSVDSDDYHTMNRGMFLLAVD
eukprot:CAMPEP_0119282204 /NCGR_PEP_ID=MMETSP1329-20130426/26234_1 /TAXON_ID=114041 /ORGANISM="Genus nov. species nov., Strain RCC1024" /LENGTH=594 /DNA_ID=CAMNT_0007282851 /DNA_START=128 /DNA_END=1909 /DNA_ORIENTATION=-